MSRGPVGAYVASPVPTVMVVVRQPTDAADRQRAPVGSWLRRRALRRSLAAAATSRRGVEGMQGRRRGAGPDTSGGGTRGTRGLGGSWWYRGAPARVRGREADARASRAAAICLTACRDASSRRDAGLTVGAQARLQGCWEAWAIGSSSSAAPWRRHVSRDWIGRMQEGMRSGGGGGNRGSAQGGVGRIAGRPCLVIRWQGHRGCMLCTTKTVACTVWTCLRSGFARERKCGRLAGPTIHQ